MRGNQGGLPVAPLGLKEVVYAQPASRAGRTALSSTRVSSNIVYTGAARPDALEQARGGEKRVCINRGVELGASANCCSPLKLLLPARRGRIVQYSCNALAAA